MKRFFITGIDTGVGKTITSVAICASGIADYWKPVQAGNLENTDTDVIRKLTDKFGVVCHDEAFRLKMAASPHIAAKNENVSIRISKFKLPDTDNHIVIEGAGGLMVPLNDNEYMIDLISALNSEIILVINNYLGSINHSLLSLKIIENYNLKLKGLVFCGSTQLSSEEYIISHSPVKNIWRIPRGEVLDFSFINTVSKQFITLWD